MTDDKKHTHHQPAMATMEAEDDQPGEEESVAFSQEECIEWVENRNVDLRQLARSPHMSITSALLGTQTTTSKKQLVDRETPDTANLVKQLDKNYSPKQEIDDLLQEEQNNASTQPQGNVATSSSSAPLGMRHRRRHREQTSLTNHTKKRVRPTTTRRPRSSGSSSSTAVNDNAGMTKRGIGNGDFDSLLQELDQPSRVPLHPTRVNLSQQGSRKSTVVLAKPWLSRQRGLPNATRLHTTKPESYAINPYPGRSTKPLPNTTVQNSQILRKRPPLTGHVQSQASAPKYHDLYPQKTANSQIQSVTGRTQALLGRNHIASSIPAECSGTRMPMPITQQAVFGAATDLSVQQSKRATTAIALTTFPEATHSMKSTSCNAISASPLMIDDLPLSEEDWKKMDALMTQQVENKCGTKKSETSYAKNESYSTKDWSTIMALDESLARARGVLEPGANKRAEDEFDDFPTFDFDAIERQIAERTVANPGGACPAAPVPSPDTAIRNSVSPAYDPQHSFIVFSRYNVVSTEVDNRTYTKSLFVKEWTVDMLKDREPSIPYPSMERSDDSLTMSDTNRQQADGHICLRGEWYHTQVDPGDIVHLCSLSGKYRTDLGALPVILHTNPPPGSDQHDDLVIIVHPDRLIPPTVISETISCSRRAVLRMRLGSTGLSSKFALFGTMRHELFERCMSSRDFSWPTAKAYVHAIVRRNAESLVGCGVQDAEAREEVLRVVPQIQQFAVTYTNFEGAGLRRQKPSIVSETVGSRLKGNGIQPDMYFVAQSVQATEEALVCPELGLKGNLDVTVSAKTTNDASGNAETSLVSIELKTGHNQNPQNAHMAQLALYTMMLRVRRGLETTGAGESGMLLYLNDLGYRAMHVTPMPNEVKSLIGQRNLVASALSRASRPRGIALAYDENQSKATESQSQRGPRIILHPTIPAALPEILPTPHGCARCYMNRECMTYAAAELISPSPKPVQGFDKTHGNLLERFTGHLRQEDLDYFQEWDRLIDLEADASIVMTTTSWLYNSHEQEKVSGKCISSMLLDDVTTMMANSESDVANDHRSAVVVMERSKRSTITTPLSRLNVESGSHVIISSDATTLHLSGDHPEARRFRHRMNIARGIVDSVDERRLKIRVSRYELAQVSRLNQQWNEACQADEPLRFRVDKDDVSTGIGTLRQNLIQLLTGDAKTAEEEETNAQSRGERLSSLRDVVIRLRVPSFDEKLGKCIFDPSKNPSQSVVEPGADCELLALAAEFSELNTDQRIAVEKIMTARDYALVQGLPGTGKTSTIAYVTRLLAAHGKRVLITSYTHAAVDNLMMKLIESGMATASDGSNSARLIRVGKKSACHHNVHPILVSTIAAAMEHSNDGDPSPDSLSHVVSSARIVGVSALTVPRTPLLVGQHFDVVIVDEAGQISQPAVLGALMAADSFVLVGDHMQLPPLVNSEAAEKGGYDISMLKRLAEKHPSAVAQLALQYRMHGDICQLCNDIVYDGKLKCANEEVQRNLLDLPGFPAALTKDSLLTDKTTCWIQEVIDPARPVLFVDTDAIRRTTTPAKRQNEASFTSGLERTSGKKGTGNVVNDTEAALVRQVVHGLLECGIETSQVGIICPFRSQLRLLSQSQSIEEWKTRGLELSTIDRYQGRDKPAIIISFVRSNANGSAGRLLEDFRRLNVAVSRAKRKLVLIGSFSTLHLGSEVLRPILQNMQHRDQIVKLPENALEQYRIA